MTRRTFDPDVTRRDDAPYWGAALVLALRGGDRTRAETARQQLRRLGVDVTAKLSRKGGTDHGRK